MESALDTFKVMGEFVKCINAEFVNWTFMNQGVCVLLIINFLILVVNSPTLIGIICSEEVMESFELK
jgi:hypothetical protein